LGKWKFGRNPLWAQAHAPEQKKTGRGKHRRNRTRRSSLVLTTIATKGRSPQHATTGFGFTSNLRLGAPSIAFLGCFAHFVIERRRSPPIIEAAARARSKKTGTCFVILICKPVAAPKRRRQFAGQGALHGPLQSRGRDQAEREGLPRDQKSRDAGEKDGHQSASVSYPSKTTVVEKTARSTKAYRERIKPGRTRPPSAEGRLSARGSSGGRSSRCRWHT